MAAGLAIALTLPSLWSGLAADDYIHAAMLRHRPGFTTEPLGLFTFVRAGDVATAGRIALPWWSSPDLQIAFWRPVSAVTHVLDYALWPDVPWLMHAHSVLWYAAAVLLAGRLFQRARRRLDLRPRRPGMRRRSDARLVGGFHCRPQRSYRRGVRRGHAAAT